MKLMSIAAMTIVAIDCIEMATGRQHQPLFSQDYIWMWLIPAIVWFGGAIHMLFLKVGK